MHYELVFGDAILKYIFLKQNFCSMILIFPTFASECPDKYFDIISGNSSEPNRREVIKWTGDDPVHWCILPTSLDGFSE